MRDTTTIKTCKTCNRAFVSDGSKSCDNCAINEQRARMGKLTPIQR